jgi:hypothetical protein
LNISKFDKKVVTEAIRKGAIDAADLSFPNLIDLIILKMKEEGYIDELGEAFVDKRARNTSIPLPIILTLAAAAKMKLKSSLTDIPYAITDAGTLSRIGWNIWDNERGLEDGLMDESVIRNLVGNLTMDDFIKFYNEYVQKYALPKMGAEANIYILDCTKIRVALKNSNYENSDVVSDDEGKSRGYKLATIRGIVGDTGIIEEIAFGSITTHDIKLSRKMVEESKIFTAGDILLNDKGFISRDMLNHMKNEKGVDTYMPLKKGMRAYNYAVTKAMTNGPWADHPNPKRRQKIAFVESIGKYWNSDKPENDVDINACVVYDYEECECRVFITTDLHKSAREIIKTYELRPEIEEDYRQIKDFWKIEDFKSTKYNMIGFHIVMVLIGYLFFQLYRLMDEGAEFVGKCLPVAVKKYVADAQKSVVVYSGSYFAVYGFLEFIQLYKSLDAEVEARLNAVLSLV